MKFGKDFWEQQYLKKQTAWDIGYPSTPIVEYIDQLVDKSIKILVPGAGNAWEVEYLWKKGFKNTFLLDFSKSAIDQFKKRVSDFPVHHIIYDDFFKHKDKYQLIIEQTFLSSLYPDLRVDYVKKMKDLLSEEGKLVGVVFNHEFKFQGPPFGATLESYNHLFKTQLELLVFETSYNSIKPRKDREHFLIAKRKINK